MTFGMVTWAILMAAVLWAAYAANRLGEKNEERGFRDTGAAILEFGRAFPNEAIRQLHATADGEVLFVRLHDNKAGFMRNMRGHYGCHLIEPGTVHVAGTPDGKGLRIDFADAAHLSGTFVFPSPQDAAEVSLWLLGNYVPEAGKVAMASRAGS
ncbi:hypothetical protein [Gellertiella hungarica]|uniref:Uncharacterized protein n=1 Tax=Gellertiella hungarica TaxID=1572859 RepID=A0A7W6J6T6_9HYPH|nr:hypothetical protein [Gellertiella hungarica]MBB4064971.1 hypothetical protein [Gellertiella hungarica]